MADITGYTAYLQATELEHAEDVLSDLLETLVSTLAPTFTLSKLEGDAAFAHAPAGRVSPSLILDTVEAGYFAFRRRLRDIDHATSCDCNACVLIPSLDLKYIVHHGEYVERRIAGTEELTGPDVILVHRLLKTDAGTALATTGFAAYTASTLDTFGMDPDVLGFTAYSEETSDMGTVELFVADLVTRWRFENERNRVYLTDEGARWSRTLELPVSVPVAWDYVTAPDKRTLWNPDITGFELQTPGRLITGSVNHCMHGAGVIIEHVADWRPFRYFTVDYPMGDGRDAPYMRMTYDFDEHSEPPTMTVRIGGGGAGFDAWWAQASPDQLGVIDHNAEILVGLWEENEAGSA
ncbi:MAG: DUF2652 domain-containing protein [Acidimicrobiia bacterium]|jgi:hypothetical protein